MTEGIDLHGLSKIFRLQFLRSVPSVMKVGSFTCELICCSEFNEPIDMDIRCVVSIYRCVNSKLIIPVSETSKVECKFNESKKNGSTAFLRVNTPDEPGYYTMHICASQDDINNTMIMPLISDVFKVVCLNEYATYLSASSAFVPRLLGCYREFNYNTTAVLIKEEYGSTLGSHIYDSSIVLMRYLQDHLSQLLPGRDLSEGCIDEVVLELGAGCGMVGLCMAALLADAVSGSIDRDVSVGLDCNTISSSAVPTRTIYITDRAQQHTLITHNVDNNAHLRTDKLHVKYQALDWASAAQIESVQNVIPGGRIDLIVAGDVFYDKHVAGLFFIITRTLTANSVGIKVLVAQKLRLDRDNKPVALLSEGEIRASCGFNFVLKVRQEADVILWLFCDLI